MFTRRLPVLLKLENYIYDQIELTKPKGKSLSNVNEQITRNENTYLAMRNFIADNTIKVFNSEKEITDKVAIKSSIAKMSNKNLEYFANEIMIEYHNHEDYIEGVYKCPRCGYKIITELRDEDGIKIDTRDRVSELKVTFMDDPMDLEFDIHLSTPTEIGSENEGRVVNTFRMSFPTIENYIQAYASVGDNNSVRYQFAVYADSILSVNGDGVDDKFRRTFGLQLFNNMEDVKHVTDTIAKNINKFGVDGRVTRTCNDCSKVWRPYVETSNFFGFGIQ